MSDAIIDIFVVDDVVAKFLFAHIANVGLLRLRPHVHQAAMQSTRPVIPSSGQSTYPTAPGACVWAATLWRARIGTAAWFTRVFPPRGKSICRRAWPPTAYTGALDKRSPSADLPSSCRHRRHRPSVFSDVISVVSFARRHCVRQSSVDLLTVMFRLRAPFVFN